MNQTFEDLQQAERIAQKWVSEGRVIRLPGDRMMYCQQFFALPHEEQRKLLDAPEDDEVTITISRSSARSFLWGIHADYRPIRQDNQQWIESVIEHALKEECTCDEPCPYWRKGKLCTGEPLSEEDTDE